MAVMLAVWWLLALMAMVQALALAEVLDDGRDSLRGLQQLQAFEAARSGLDWGLAQADASASPCPLPAAMLTALKTPGTAVADTAWMGCAWPPASGINGMNDTTSSTSSATGTDSAGAAGTAAPTPTEPVCQCALSASGATGAAAVPGAPGYGLQFSRAAGSAWLLLQATGCGSDCDPLLGHTARQSLQWRWLPAWLAPGAWPVALLAGGRVSAQGTTPVSVDAPGAWAIIAAQDGLEGGSGTGITGTATSQTSQTSPTSPSSSMGGVALTGGRWDSVLGPHPAAALALPSELATWLGQPAHRLADLWVATRWPPGTAAPAAGGALADPTAPLIVLAGDWSVPAGTRLGSVQKPVLLRVDGTLRIDAPGVRITGLVVAGAVAVSAGLQLDGALWSGGNVAFSGTEPISLRHDAALAQAAWLRAGRFVARRGSWRDF